MSRARLLLLAAAIAAPAAARAQTCTASATALSFGSYNPFASTPTDSTASITVTCQTVTPVTVLYAIALNGGGGTVAARRMAGGASLLSYQLYTSPARTTVWGDGSSATTTVTDGYTLGILGVVTRSYAVYGRVPTNQRVAPGLYADTVLISITY